MACKHVRRVLHVAPLRDYIAKITARWWQSGLSGKFRVEEKTVSITALHYSDQRSVGRESTASGPWEERPIRQKERPIVLLYVGHKNRDLSY